MKSLSKILALLAIIAYPILLHTFILKPQVEMWQLLFVFAPMLAGATWLIFRAVSRSWRPLLLLAISILVYFIISKEQGRIGLLAVNGLSHASIYLFLLWLFGSTLLHDRVPLITQIATHIIGPLEPEIIRYTWQVTVAWCVLFALQITISLLLYIFAPLAIWSFFINVMDLPLLTLMFIAEYGYRRARYPNHPRTPILRVIEVYAKEFSAPKKPLVANRNS